MGGRRQRHDTTGRWAVDLPVGSYQIEGPRVGITNFHIAAGDTVSIVRGELAPNRGISAKIDSVKIDRGPGIHVNEWHTLGRGDGLPITSIAALLFDREGSLWLGGEGGLCRYEGSSKFIHFSLRSNPTTRVRSIVEDLHGTLWIGTDSGLVRYTNGSLTFFDAADGLPDPSVYSLMIDRSGRLWVAQRAVLWSTMDSLSANSLTAMGLPEAKW